VPSQIHTRQLVKIQSEERLATTSELNPTPDLVTGRCEAGGMGYQAATEVKVISPEILIVLEADVICVTEGSIHSTISPNLQSWNIAMSSGVSPTGSQTAAWYQTEIMGTRETQYALPAVVGVCVVKPMNGKTAQMAYWESDQFIVLMKQGNACGGKGLTNEPLGQGHIFHTQMRAKGDNKTVLTTYPEMDREVLLKSRMRKIFTSGSVRELIVTSELLLQ